MPPMPLSSAATRRRVCRSTFANSSDVLFVDLGQLLPADRMQALKFYDSGSIDGDATFDVHMSAEGYETASDLAVAKILALT